MSTAATPRLTAGYTFAVDTLDENSWSDLLSKFDDANIYQSWPYSAVVNGRRNMSHVVVMEDGEIVAAAQARIVRAPLLNVGAAYVRWGPLWRRSSSPSNPERLRQALRALRNEYVFKRGLVLKLFPVLFEDDAAAASVLAEEGFESCAEKPRGRTIMMDIQPAVPDLYAGMNAHWKRELKVAEKKGLEIIEGSHDTLLQSFIVMYREMVRRKKFIEPNDIEQFREIQSRLAEGSKMRIMLCMSGGQLCSGLICSAMGNTAVYLFGATSDAGMKSRGSYLLHWNLIEQLKNRNISVYNLNGINPEKNPGTYKFKRDLAGSNGRDVHFLGHFDAHAGAFAYTFVKGGEKFRALYRNLRARRLALP
jgi:lipid II:glycine glycyltransferase (peptidoglycan interpeptide bridge formation enzyme)